MAIISLLRNLVSTVELCRPLVNYGIESDGPPERPESPAGADKHAFFAYQTFRKERINYTHSQP